jgi:aspartate aminotransferase-like enzyme
MNNQLLFTPGPVPLPPEVLAAGANVEIYHQSDAFGGFVQDLSSHLQHVMLASTPVLMMSGSAMTGIDACAASLQREHDTVLVLHHGRFGERVRDIARIYSDNVINVSAPWGETIGVEAVEAACASLPRIDVVWCVHSETSTGVSLDLAAIASVVHRLHPDALICVDAVTSVAIQELRTEEWGLDAVVTGIQKGLCCSPGIAVVALSERAREKASATRGRYTLDLHRVDVNLQSHRMTWTPPTSLLAQLSASLKLIRDRGLETVWHHHESLHRDVRACAEERGFAVWGASTSRGVLVLSHPRGEHIRTELERSHNIIVANGQDQMAGKVVRFGLCGSYSLERYSILFDAIDRILSK